MADALFWSKRRDFHCLHVVRIFRETASFCTLVPPAPYRTFPVVVSYVLKTEMTLNESTSLGEDRPKIDGTDAPMPEAEDEPKNMQTREECEKLLAEMIIKKKAEIAEMKKKAKAV